MGKQEGGQLRAIKEKSLKLLLGTEDPVRDPWYTKKTLR